MGAEETQEAKEPLEDLPDLREVFLTRRQTRLELGEGVAEAADRELLKCCARAVAFNHPAAFDDLLEGEEAALAAGELGPEDTEAARRSRKAWTELFMFSKTCLPALPGGRAKEKRNRNVVTTRLRRWAVGERATLWKEVADERGEQPGRRRGPSVEERRGPRPNQGHEQLGRRDAQAHDPHREKGQAL